MSRKYQEKPTMLIIWQSVVPALLPPVLTNFQTVEQFLLSIAMNKLSMWVSIALLSLIIFLFPFYLRQRAIRPLNQKQRKELLKTIKDMVEAQYSLHTNNELSKNFDELLNNEASRGVSLPTGALAGKVSDLYLSEIGVYSKLLEDAISQVSPTINTKTFQQYLPTLVNELLYKYNTYIKALYSRFANGYYKNMGIEHINMMNTSFSKQADAEIKQRLKYLVSINNLTKFT